MASSLVATGVQFPDTTIQTTAATAGIPSGTVMLFVQTAAPTGFTKSTTHDNKALRVVSGSVSSGGSVAFTTAFASQTPSGSVSVSGSVGNTTLSVAQMPSHTHAAGSNLSRAATDDASGNTARVNDAGGNATSSAGSNNAHNHGLTISSSTFSGNAINLAVQYVDVIIATKN